MCLHPVLLAELALEMHIVIVLLHIYIVLFGQELGRHSFQTQFSLLLGYHNFVNLLGVVHLATNPIARHMWH